MSSTKNRIEKVLRSLRFMIDEEHKLSAATVYEAIDLLENICGVPTPRGSEVTPERVRSVLADLRNVIGDKLVDNAVQGAIALVKDMAAQLPPVLNRAKENGATDTIEVEVDMSKLPGAPQQEPRSPLPEWLKATKDSREWAKCFCWANPEMRYQSEVVKAWFKSAMDAVRPKTGFFEDLNNDHLRKLLADERKAIDELEQKYEEALKDATFYKAQSEDLHKELIETHNKLNAEQRGRAEEVKLSNYSISERDTLQKDLNEIKQVLVAAGDKLYPAAPWDSFSTKRLVETLIVDFSNLKKDLKNVSSHSDFIQQELTAAKAREVEKDRIIQHDVTELHATLREIVTSAGIVYQGGIKNHVAILADKKREIQVDRDNMRVELDKIKQELVAAGIPAMESTGQEDEFECLTNMDMVQMLIAERDGARNDLKRVPTAKLGDDQAMLLNEAREKLAAFRAKFREIDKSWRHLAYLEENT